MLVGISHILHLRRQSLCLQWSWCPLVLVVVTVSLVVLAYVVHICVVS